MDVFLEANRENAICVKIPWCSQRQVPVNSVAFADDISTVLAAHNLNETESKSVNTNVRLKTAMGNSIVMNEEKGESVLVLCGHGQKMHTDVFTSSRAMSR